MRSSKIILLIAAALFTSLSAFSQETVNETTVVVDDVVDADAKVETQIESKETSPSRRGVEKVEVTGSHIRRTDVEGPSPVVTIDREAIENSGFNSVGQLLRGSTVSPFGGSSAAVNLKGIGSARTLVLINGERAPKSGDSYSSGATDPNFVPLAAVERIEILKDGASATYGSDALGGVVNIITRKNMDGYNFTTKYDFSDYLGGDVSRSSLAYASNSGRSSFLTSVQYTYTQETRFSAIKNLKPYVQNPYFSSNYITANSGGLKAAPDCPADSINDEGQCQENTLSSRYLSRASHEAGTVTTWNYDITSDTQFYSTVIFNYSNYGNQYPTLVQTQFGQGELNQNVLLTEKGDNNLQGYSTGDPIRTFGRLGDVNRPTTTEDFMGGIIVGTKGYWGNSDWTWDTSVNNQILMSHERNANYVKRDAMHAAIREGRYKPFSTQPQNVNDLIADNIVDNKYQVNWANAKTTGELGQFLGASWATAVGVSAAHFEYSDDRDDRIMSNNFIGLQGTEGRGERQLYAEYGEISGLFGKTFEAQFAVRNDNYSDFGSTVNPKVALRYQPAKAIMFRGSAGTGFQAPRLQDTYGPTVEGFPQIVDQKKCNEAKKTGIGVAKYCAPNSVAGVSGANRNLKEETSESYNVGMVVEPIKRFTISLDYWAVNIEDTVSNPSLNRVMELDAMGVDVSKYGIGIERNNNTGDLEKVSYQIQNIGKEEVDGLDIEMNYLMKTQVGDFNLITAHTYMFNYFQTFFQEFGREQVLGQFGRPRWRNVSQVRYTRGNFLFGVTARSFARTEKSVRNSGSIEGITQWDAVLGYKLSSNSSLQLGGLNVFDQTPQWDETLRERINGGMYNTTRTAYMTYRQDF